MAMKKLATKKTSLLIFANKKKKIKAKNKSSARKISPISLLLRHERRTTFPAQSDFFPPENQNGGRNWLKKESK